MSYARPAERQGAGSGLFLRGLVASGEVVARNPAVAGGTTAFIVSLFFVSANAMWYQPHFHEGAFFATRAAHETVSPPIPSSAPARPARQAVEQPTVDESGAPVQARDNETTGAIPAAQAPAAGAGAGDAAAFGTVGQVQSVLKKLGLYQGTVDGLTGPQTRAAVQRYQKIVGLEPTGAIGSDVLDHLGIDAPAASTSAAPHPTPRPDRSATAAEADPVAAIVENAPKAPPKPSAAPGNGKDAKVVKVQAGLRAFGNDGIPLDGKVDDGTRKALKEFQSLFGLPVTGEPDAAVVAKMKDIGLIN